MEYVLTFIGSAVAGVLYWLLSHILETLQEIQKDVDIIKDRLLQMEKDRDA